MVMDGEDISFVFRLHLSRKFLVVNSDSCEILFLLLNYSRNKETIPRVRSLVLTDPGRMGSEQRPTALASNPPERKK